MQNIDIKDFGIVGAVDGSDYIVVSLISGTSGKVQVKTFSQIITKDISPSVGEDGYWYVGDKPMNVKAAAETPQFRRGNGCIEYKYPSEDQLSWRPLVLYDELRLKYSELTENEIVSFRMQYSDLKDDQLAALRMKYSDLTEEQIGTMALKYEDLTEEQIESFGLKYENLTEEQRKELSFGYEDLTEDQIKEIQKPALDAADSMNKLKEEVLEAEEGRIEASKKRAEEFSRLREQAVESSEMAIEAALDASHTPTIKDHTWWIWDSDAEKYKDTGSPATSRSPKIENGVWWIWNDYNAEYESTGYAVNSEFHLTKEAVEGVFTGDIDTHTHQHIRYRAQIYEDMPDLDSLVSWTDELGEHPYLVGNDIYVRDEYEPTGYANYKLSPSVTGNVWVRIPLIAQGYRVLLLTDSRP